jgi:hypothetical protein
MRLRKRNELSLARHIFKCFSQNVDRHKVRNIEQQLTSLYVLLPGGLSKISMRLQDFALTFHRLRSFGQPKSAQRSHQGKLLVATKTGALLSVGSLSWICVLIIYCVACCLACSEFPETLSLTDDSSNDFMVVSEVCSAIRSEAVESRAVSQITIHPTTPTTRPLLICHADAFPRQSQPGPDLLTLISLRRI